LPWRSLTRLPRERPTPTTSVIYLPRLPHEGATVNMAYAQRMHLI